MAITVGIEQAKSTFSMILALGRALSCCQTDQKCYEEALLH